MIDVYIEPVFRERDVIIVLAINETDGAGLAEVRQAVIDKLRADGYTVSDTGPPILFESDEFGGYIGDDAIERAIAAKGKEVT